MPFDEPVHLVEEGRHLLHLIENDGECELRWGPGQELLTEEGRPRREGYQQIGAEEVEGEAAGKGPTQKRRFAGLPGPPQKRRLVLGKCDRKASLEINHSGTTSILVIPEWILLPFGSRS